MQIFHTRIFVVITYLPEENNLLINAAHVFVYPTKVVFLGDHKQLRPIITNRHAGNMGMSTSLFERYCTTQREIVIMLDTQYRMVSNHAYQ